MRLATVRVDVSDPFGRRDLDELVEVARSTCVSLYLPTHRSGVETAQDPVRLRNLLASARRELAALDLNADQIEDLLRPAGELLAGRDWWQHQSDGLAMFCAPGFFRVFRLPISVAVLAVVATRFHVRPLLPLVASDGRFWLLALSQNSVRLFSGTELTISELDTADTPTSMAEALAHEDPEKERQIRSTGPNGLGQSYGHAGGGEDDKAAIERYFRAVDRGLAGLALDPSVPLVIAGVSYYGPIFRAVSVHPDILDDVVAGSPDDLSAVELHELAWAAVRAHLEARRRRWQDRYGQARADGRSAEGLLQVATAANEGRVELLILPSDGSRWASTDLAGDAIEHDQREPGDVDLLDVVAQQVLRTGGEIVVMKPDELPEDAIPAAILRYR
ncbi:MAG: hypothetical protein ACKVWR_03645 [Acidimicrobiales bacterium]